MKTESKKTYSLVEKNIEGHEFVNGNTKHLKDMNQIDLKVLFDNGDPRVTAKDVTETAIKSTSAPKPAQAIAAAATA